MKLGYITFSAEEQQLVHNVIQQISQGALDELGLGRIRDAFSDAMFPGMSTLHRKSKYFVLLPALYDQLSKTQISDKGKIQELIREYEINMTIGLLNGVSQSIDHTGITGSSLEIDKLKAGHYVKNTPSNIYLSSLKYFGLVSDKMNLPDLIWQQSRINHDISVRGRKSKDEILEDPDGTDIHTGRPHNFHPFPGYDFTTENAISLQLTESEAEILRTHILEKCKDKDGHFNLYGHLLNDDSIEIRKDFFDMKDIIHGFSSDELKCIYDFACDFSRWANLMNSYYRYAFHRSFKNDKAIDDQITYIREKLDKNDIPSQKRIQEILEYVKQLPNFRDVNKPCDFCLNASELLDIKAEDKLLQLIAMRDKSIKGSH